MRDPLLEVEALSIVYGHGKNAHAAVDDVSFRVMPSEILAIVGESGCGKSSLARGVAGIVTPASGRILLDGQPIRDLEGAAALAARRAVQMVFQDPDASLNPSHTVSAILHEPLIVTGFGSLASRHARVAELMALVRLDASLLERRPSGLSGGQKQRVAIARALAMAPRLLIADEALSALDLTAQARMAALFLDIRDRLGVALLFISHDMRMVAQIADTVCVIKSGRVVEYGPVKDVMMAPKSAYTRLLLAAGLDPKAALGDPVLLAALAAGALDDVDSAVARLLESPGEAGL
ncbi:MAG TPA: ATP-binding cassette domain-containing protein [Pararhizobium sp.]|uniref:ABC transporter ATP-binding protein n=1 Tax=Pararhizobium sp. TaxID=1977563 RepID=UPI002CB47F94|nr:ATP-binding cassette domain-containing protein [Pararhizobium sp.]HTO34478.1 ATP-binding cassette domain-containing protein [Pararhizobium sp.]